MWLGGGSRGGLLLPVYGGGGVRLLRLELRERYAGSWGSCESSVRRGASSTAWKIGGMQVELGDYVMWVFKDGVSWFGRFFYA